MPPRRLTPNQVVAWNLKRARNMHGWSQDEAAEHLKPFLGQRWSKATFSACERSVDGTRVRQFTADDLVAFSMAFGVPVTYFLCPPPWVEEIGHADSYATALPWDYLDRLFDVGENAAQWLLREVMPMTAQTTRALRQWGKNFAAMTDRREHEVEALLAVREEENR